MTDLLGLLAGFLTTISLVPQVRQIWKTKSAKDVSLPMFVAFSIGVALWLAYGALKGEVPIILWNGVALLLSGCIVAMKLRYR